MATGDIRWSEEIAGDAGNYRWPVTFSEMDGYVNIIQQQENDTDSVLLSPAQVRALLAFVRPARRRGRAKATRR